MSDAEISEQPDQGHGSGTEREAAAILKERSRAEQQLLKDERDAERRLAKSEAAQRKLEARLKQMERRVMRGRESVASAVTELRACQERRMAGPPPSSF